MAVYTHFGRIPELLRAVVHQGFKELDRAIAQVPVTDDPVADLSAMALACRQFARQNPHLYDLMFGLSTRRATYRPLPDSDLRFSGRSPAFHRAYVRLHAACQRLVSSGRARRLEPEVRLDQLAVGIGERGASTVYAGARNPDTTPAVRAEVLDGPCIAVDGRHRMTAAVKESCVAATTTSHVEYRTARRDERRVPDHPRRWDPRRSQGGWPSGVARPDGRPRIGRTQARRVCTHGITSAPPGLPVALGSPWARLQPRPDSRAL